MAWRFVLHDPQRHTWTTLDELLSLESATRPGSGTRLRTDSGLEVLVLFCETSHPLDASTEKLRAQSGAASDWRISDGVGDATQRPVQGMSSERDIPYRFQGTLDPGQLHEWVRCMRVARTGCPACGTLPAYRVVMKQPEAACPRCGAEKAKV